MALWLGSAGLQPEALGEQGLRPADGALQVSLSAVFVDFIFSCTPPPVQRDPEKNSYYSFPSPEPGLKPR